MKNPLADKNLDPGNFNFILAKPDSGEVEIELWNSFRAGSREALDTIFEKYVRILYAYGRNITSERDLLSDCIQDVFVELWIKRQILSPRIDSIKYYLIKSVRRRVVRRLSEEGRLKAEPLSQDGCESVDFNVEFSMIQDQVSKERTCQLEASIATLSKAQREAVYLRFYQNMSYEEVASVMKTNVKSIYNLIGRAITSLREFFKAHPIANP